MAASIPSTSAKRRSWRGGGPTGADPQFKRVARIVLTAVALALLVVLAVLLIPPFFRAETHFVAVPVVDYEVLSVPPLSFSSEDLHGFAPLSDLLARDSQPAPMVLAELQTSQAMQSLLGGQLRNFVARSKDVLIVYLSAQGLSDGGVPYLLCSDFNPANPGAGRQRLGDVLRQVSGCRCSAKLVLLDSARSVSDPRLGMLVNEFPRLIEREVRAIADPTLWVLSSHDLAETSLVSYALRRSRFAYALSEGLNGRAESDGDGLISLAEVHEFVRRDLANWAEHVSGGLASQTPVLLRGGVGHVAELQADVRLLPARASSGAAQAQAGSFFPSFVQSAYAEPQTAKDAPASASIPLEPAKTPADSPPATKPAAPPPPPAKHAEPAAPAPAPAHETTAQAAAIDVSGLLDQAWQLRDQLGRRDENSGWAPIDYAPHLWREFEELILGYELRYRAGTAFDRKALADDVRRNILALTPVVQDGAAAASGGSTIAERLAAARRQFLSGEVRTTYESQPAEVRSAAALLGDAVLGVVRYLHWLEQSSTLAAGGEALADDLDQTLQALADLSQRLEEFFSSTSAKASGLREDTDRLRDALAAQEARLQAEVTGWLRDRPQPSNLVRIDSVLATPLLRADQRARLQQCLLRSDQPAPSSVASPRSVPPAFDGRQWQRVVRQATCELALVRWADPDPSKWSRLEQTLQEAIDRRASTPTPETDEQAWRAAAGLGAALAGFYRNLPATILSQTHAAQGLSGSERLTALRAVERLLRLIDARDARLVDPQISIAPLPQSNDLALAITAPASVRASTDDWTALEIGVRSESGHRAEVLAALAFDSARIEIRSAEGDPPDLGADNYRRLVLDDQGRATLRVQIKAKAEGGASTPLKITLETGGKPVARTVKVELPAPQRIDLLVRGTPGTFFSAEADPDAAAPLDQGNVQLLPFPNQVTRFRLALANRGEREEKVRVVLLAAPRVRGMIGQRPELPDADADWSAAGFEALAPTQEMSLPASGEAQVIRFAAEPAAKPADGAAAPPAKETPPAAKVRPAIAAGLVCVVRSRNQRFVKWIDISAQPPRNYLEAEASYDRAQGRIQIDVRPRDFDHDGRPDSERLPPGGSKLQWDIGGDIDPTAAMQSQGEVSGPRFAARLFADVPPDPQKQVDVEVSVDGYPRAFVWRVRADASDAHLRPRRDLQRVKIVSPRSGEAFRAPLAALPVMLKIDAPADAFRDPAAGDLLEVGLDAALDRSLTGAATQRFYSDRQVAIFLDNLGTDGTLAIDTQVHDFQIELKPLGLLNTTVEIGAELTVGGAPPEDDFVQVVLDGAPPEIDVVTQQTGGIVQQGSDLLLVAVGRDLSGIKTVETAFDLARSGKLEKPVLASFNPTSGSWRAALPTKDLAVGNYVALARATDNVGLQSDLKRVAVVVVAPRMAAPIRPENSIMGLVRLAGEPQAGVVVTLSGASAATTSSDGAGRFVFRNLPPGKYKVGVKAAIKNRLREAGPLDVDLQAAPNPPAGVTLDLE